MTTLAQNLESKFSNAKAAHLALVVGGAIAIALTAQISVHLPFTPVPITGQTFGVAVVALLLGRVRGLLAVLTYLSAGALGAPVFADFSSITALWGPTSGYLLGFIPAAFVAGTMADKALTTSWSGALLASFAAQTLILLVGAAVLISFVGINNVWAMGVAPFLLGDVVKSVAATLVVKSL